MHIITNPFGGVFVTLPFPLFFFLLQTKFLLLFYLRNTIQSAYELVRNSYNLNDVKCLKCDSKTPRAIKKKLFFYESGIQLRRIIKQYIYGLIFKK